MQLLERAVVNAWNIKPEWVDAAAREALRLMLKSDDERVRLRAARVIQMFEHNGAQTALAIERLQLDRDKLGNETDQAEDVLRLPDGPWSAAGSHIDPDAHVEAPMHQAVEGDDAD